MPIDKEAWYIYAKNKGVSRNDAQKYWDTAKDSIKNKTQSEYNDDDWIKVIGTYKKIISNSIKESYFINEDDTPDLDPFIGYAKNQGLDNEEQASAIFFQVRGKVAKEQDEDPEKLSPDTMGILWGEYKEAIKKALEKKESFILKSNIILENVILKKGSKIQLVEQQLSTTYEDIKDIFEEFETLVEVLYKEYNIGFQDIKYLDNMIIKIKKYFNIYDKELDTTKDIIDKATNVISNLI